jgi:hypothetical protein
MSPKALACRECGSDEHTGWKSEEDIEFEALDLGDPIPETSNPLARRTAIIILAVILLMTLSFGYMMLWLVSTIAGS